MLFCKFNVQILNFYVVGNSVSQTTDFLFMFSVCVSLHLEENKSAFKASESSFSFFEDKKHLHIFSFVYRSLKILTIQKSK